MSVINFRRKEIVAKVVYYGPGLSGKTTNVQQIHASMPLETRGELTSLATEQDRTLFFDYVPIHLGNIGGFKTRFQIFTVPGQVFYSATRRVVLQSTDGVVFVADSSPDAMERNRESLADLRQNLLSYDKFLNAIPFVIQYNKRDLPDAMPIEELERELNLLGVPSLQAVATDGEGVLETLSKISSLVLTHLKASIEGKLSQGKKDPGMVEHFDEDEPGDETLVRHLLAQISLVRKDEHAAEISIVDEEDDVPRSVMPMRLPPRPASTFAAMPSIAGNGMPDAPALPPTPSSTPPPAPAGGLEVAAAPGYPAQQGGINPTGHALAADAPPPAPRALPQDSYPPGSVHPLEAHSSSYSTPRPAPTPPPPPSSRISSPDFRGPAQPSGERPLPPSPPPRTNGEWPASSPGPRTSSERAALGHQPGDPPPWDTRTSGNRSNPSVRPLPAATGSRAIPVPTGAPLEVIDVGQVIRHGGELMVPVTVRDAGTGDIRPLQVQLKLVNADLVWQFSSLPPFLYAWLGGITVLTLLALALAVF